MKRKYFGTDGIRGEANKFPMDPATVLKIGMAAGVQFMRGDYRHRVVIGKDTRLSGYMLEAALEAGFTSVGMDVVLVGPMPTPAVAMLTKSLRCDLGVMLSASHNPYKDNGIKLFGPDGHKLSDELEAKIEENIDKDLSKFLASADKLGRAKRLDDAPGRYIEFVKNTLTKNTELSGIKIVVDSANGAAYHLASSIFWELGAEVFPINKNPTGFNINEKCGSTYPEFMAEEVKKQKADIGFAFDGDADRIIVADEKGNIIDGDQIMALIATFMNDKKLLRSKKIVATEMSNMGLEEYLRKEGLELVRAKVGDRYVTEKMKETKANLGGEQSGHIILSDYSTTGDALISALQILAVLKESGKKASALLNVFSPYPQLLKNVKFSKGDDPLESEKVKKVINDNQQKLKGEGRVFIRKSGTEPLIRIMVEGKEKEQIRKIAEEIASEIEKTAS